MKKTYQVLIFVFLLLCIFLGGLLGIWLIGKNTGDYDWSLVYPIIGGIFLGAIFTFLFSHWKKKKKGNIPAIDERSLVLLKRYFIGAFYIIMIGTSAVLLILFGIGIKSIETGIIIIYLCALYLLLALGTMITKRL
ncbi:MAG: hypothetical protein ABF649_09985 [Bacillus sp. (in: firmicutes)]